MAIRQTSIDCYNIIKSNGLLSKRRLEVLETILQSAPCTSSEAIKNAKVTFGVFGVSSRFTELRDLGVIYEKGIKKCTVTGRNVIEWDLTDKLPLKEKASVVTKKQKIEEVLNEISALGKKLSNEEEKKDLRSIYLKIKALK
jgi:hypothetical protein